MKLNKILVSLFVAVCCLTACSEEETLPTAQAPEFATTADGRIVPVTDLYIRTLEGVVVYAGIDGVPVNGVDTARFVGVDYSNQIEDVGFVLPEGASIDPIPTGKRDSMSVEVDGVSFMVRKLWNKDDVYTITLADKSSYKIAFKLEDFIAKEPLRGDDDPGPEPNPSESGVVFVDLFNDENGIPDESVWKLCEKGSSTWNVYFADVNGYENVRVEDGFLKLIAKKGDDGKYKNGGIRTKSGFANNTRLEVRAKLSHKVRGGFPAIWQMPINGAMWPTSGEIDVMEWIQGTPNVAYQTVHYDPSGTGKDVSATRTPTVDVTKWHTYRVDRTDKALTFYVDGVKSLVFENKGSDNWMEYPFNRYDYDIILNFSLGGAGTWPGVIRDEDLPGEMWVDWVRVSSLTD